jgi:hypothetical protein
MNNVAPAKSSWMAIGKRHCMEPLVYAIYKQSVQLPCRGISVDERTYPIIKPITQANAKLQQ